MALAERQLSQLGVDVGSTWTRAAMRREGEATLVRLREGRAAMPSVVVLGTDSRPIAASAPDAPYDHSTADDVMLRLGDPTPVPLGGATFPSTDLLTALLARVATVVGGHDEPYESTVVVPASWGGYRRSEMRAAAAAAGLQRVAVVSAAIAVAARYGRRSALADGELVGVYDLGGRTFNCAVVLHAEGGYRLLGQADGVERLGGDDLDAALARHVQAQLAEPLDDSGRETRTALLLACRAVRELLSSRTAAVVDVPGPGRRGPVTVTRRDLVELTEPLVQQTVDAVRRTLESAFVRPQELSALVLVGGVAATPLLADQLAERLGCHVHLPPDPADENALAAAEWMAPASEQAIAPGGAGAVPIPSGVDPLDEDHDETPRPLHPLRTRWALAGAIALAVVALSLSLLPTGQGDEADQVLGTGSEVLAPQTPAGQAPAAPEGSALPSLPPTPPSGRPPSVTGRDAVWYPQRTIATGVGVPGSAVRLADLDGDGRDDYVALAADGTADAWLNGDGRPDDWTWVPQGTVAVAMGAAGSAVQFADLDGDGRDDYLAVADDGPVEVWLNAGGRPGDWDWYPQGPIGPRLGVPGASVRFADLDGDDRDDYLVVADDGGVEAWLNGGGRPGDWRWYPLGTIASGVGAPGEEVRFGDLNGDGWDDYLVVSGSSAMRPWLNGGGQAGAWNWYPQDEAAAGVGVPGAQIRFADVDDDGRCDYVVVDSGSGALKAWLN